MLARQPRKFDYNLSPIGILKETRKSRMGCASSQAAIKGSVTKSESGTLTVVEPVKYPPAEAFEIPLDEDEVDQMDSIIKKHPPKRLQRLAEVPALTSTTIEDLEEKLAKAEIRRKNYLQQKIEGINSIPRPRDPTNNDNDNPTDFKESPTQDSQVENLETDGKVADEMSHSRTQN